MTASMNSRPLIWECTNLAVAGVNVTISSVRREGPSYPILILHGFGSTKEDFVDIALAKAFSGASFVIYDTPGSGQSTSEKLDQLSIPFLVELAEEFLKSQRIRKFHLIGHSMGGLTALKLAQRHPDAVLSFVNMKGNLAPEDCFLSRQVLDHPSDNPEIFFRQFVERTRKSQEFGTAIYAAALQAKVKPEVVRPTFESMVHLSDTEDLLDIFISLPCSKMFMYGEQYNTLSYLSRLSRAGVELAEIPNSAHFIMYSNPVEMWRRIALFHAKGLLEGHSNQI
ncbi:unnamed protein product [Clonostachys solani]|uniref:AB hydrolase-1 domain-containing protein n=1 Tax=Clonostachys solani TaxID=160281 RepID=A0A9N9Z9W1_9HYPO|nr:unnamed protein product [Clonostachys solani]